MFAKLKFIMKDKGKRTLADLIVGIIAYSLIVLLIGEIFATAKFSFALGIILGATGATLMSLHMYKTLESAILLDKKNAQHKAKLGAFFRLLLMMAALIVSAVYNDYVSFIGTFLGFITLKISALSQPLIDKLVIYLMREEE